MKFQLHELLWGVAGILGMTLLVVIVELAVRR